jgi:hypothetical protein
VNSNVKGTPQQQLSQKLAMKQTTMKQDQFVAPQQAAGNQQQPVRYNMHTVKKSITGVVTGPGSSQTRNVDQNSYPEREKSTDVKQNNFIPSSNLSQFLLKKGSNGSLHTFENEYSYKINLNNLNQATGSQVKSTKKSSTKAGNVN